MKLLCLIALLVLALLPVYLLSDPTYMSMEAGYALGSDSAYIGIGFPMQYLSPIKSGSLITKVFWKDVGGVQGFETNAEPYSWWVPTGEEIWSASSIHIGYMMDIPGADMLSIAPHIGFGTTYTYTQYISSATNIGFYNRTEDRFTDIGIDLSLHTRYIGVVVGGTVTHGVYLGLQARI